MTEYSKDEIEEKIKKSVAILHKEHHFLLREENDLNERTVTSQLREILAGLFREYDVDAEYNRMFEDGRYVSKRARRREEENPIELDVEEVPTDDTEAKTVFPDIIVHKRGTDLNLLVVEVKMQWKSGKSDDDFKKLERYTAGILGYKFGIYLELADGGITDLKWFPEEKEGECIEVQG